MGIPSKIEIIDLVTVLEAILTSRQAGEKLQCLDENLMSNNFRKTNVLKKIERILYGRAEIRNFSSSVEKYFTRSLRSLVKYFFIILNN